MKIDFIERNYDIGKRLRDLITKKVEKLDRYFGDDAIVRVVCSLQNKTYKLELTIINKGLVFRSEVVGENMYENIDMALPKIEKQILRQSDKRKNYFKPNAFVPQEFLYVEEMPKFDNKEIYKKKTFKLEPMTIEEAIFALDAVEHDFYVFLNGDTNKVNILYKRQDGKLGLIQCEY